MNVPKQVAWYHSMENDGWFCTLFPLKCFIVMSSLNFERRSALGTGLGRREGSKNIVVDKNHSGKIYLMTPPLEIVARKIKKIIY